MCYLILQTSKIKAFVEILFAVSYLFSDLKMLYCSFLRHFNTECIKKNMLCSYVRVHLILVVLMVKITMWIKDEFHILFRLNLIKQFQLEHEINCFI